MPFDAQYEEKGNGMNWKRTARWSWLILPFLLLALWPAMAAAQLGVRDDANSIMYEVTENLKLKPLQNGRGLSTAALMGSVNGNTSICPVPVSCGITAIATRSINLATGTGPVAGTFSVVGELDGGQSNPVDGPEAVLLRGNLGGTIDLSQALLFAATGGAGGSPTGTISGRWSARGAEGGPFEGLHAHGQFEGTFRLPIEPAPGVVLYVGAGGFVPVLDNERSLAEPTVRLELKFVTK